MASLSLQISSILIAIQGASSIIALPIQDIDTAIKNREILLYKLALTSKVAMKKATQAILGGTNTWLEFHGENY